MEISALSPVLKLIGGLVTDEVTSLWGVKDQIEDLQRELQWMQSFLQEADTRKVAGNAVVRTCVAEMRELAYDAEDVIESFVLKVASIRKEGVCNAIKRCACCFKEGWLLHKTNSRIEKITARIKKLKSRLSSYDVRRIREELGGGPSTSSNARWEQSRRPYPHIRDDHVVGLEDDINKLVSILVDDETNGNCRVVSICGMGGLGKTTLAKKVYHHSQVRNQFNNHLAFVYVSQQCQSRKVWEDILSSLISPKERGSKLSNEELAARLFNFLKNNKCLVMLDDIWSIEAWDSLKPAFPMTETSSKILLTSRNMDIVRYADPRGGYLYELECLNEEESWELFQKFAFFDRDSPGYTVESKKEVLGKDMVKACAGLPLAIIVLAGILAKRKSLNQWQTTSENVKSYLKKDEGAKVSEQVLALSYEDLSPLLKPCFLYLSQFPEDYEIHVDTLIQLWVAEGFVLSDQQEDEGGEIMEDVAERYLNELVDRCLIQVGEVDATSKIKTCRMHDLMRDLCLSKAKQENFVFIIDHSNSFQSTRSHSSLSTNRAVRRIVEHEFTPVQWIRSSTHLRSILFFGDGKEFDDDLYPEAFLNPTFSRIFKGYNDNILVFLVLASFVLHKMKGCWSCMFRNFKLLRVIGFLGYHGIGTRSGGCKLPSGIGNLIHLRFLSLRGMEFLCPKMVPSSLGNLRCLQTLDLRVDVDPNYIPFHIPDVIWRLEQLRHLYLPGYYDYDDFDDIFCKTKLKLHTLRKLQTLVNFNTNHCFIQDLCSLINLRKLEMVLVIGALNINTEEDHSTAMAIIKSKHIGSLRIECSTSLAFDGTTNIVLLQILSSCLSTICELSLEAMIGKLPDNFSNSNYIAYLRLRWCQLEEDPMPTLEKLPNLRILKLEVNAFIGTRMVCSAKHFPKLYSLTLQKLKNLEEWEVEQGAMPAIRSLEIRDCCQLKMLPQGLKFVSTLQELTIKGMSYSFVSKLKSGGQDFYKIQHIPSIIGISR